MPSSHSSVDISRSPEGKGYLLQTSQLLQGSLSQVFDFFSDAMQLESITPPWLSFHVTTPQPILIQEGTLIDYRLKLHGIPINWQTRIAEWEPPYRFVDEQLKGPYLWWHHEHVFEEVPDGILMTDRVHYGVPGGGLVHWLLVHRDVQRIFEYRRRRMTELFSQPAACEIPVG